MENLEKVLVSLQDSRPLVKIGWAGENQARGIIWDISKWQELYGEGTCTLLNQRETDDAPYPCSITIDGKFAVWQVTDGDLGTGGNGKCQLIYQVGEEVVAKSPVYRTLSSKSLGNETEPPESASDWILQVLQAGQDAVDAAERAEDAAKKAQDTADGATEAINSAATTGIQAVNTAGQAAVGAVGNAQTSAVFAVNDAKNAGVQAVNDEKKTAVEAVQGAQTTALNAITEAQTQATEAVEAAGNQALQDISAAKTSAMSDINTAGENAVNSVNSASQTAVENAQTAINDTKGQAVTDVQNAGQSAVGTVENAQADAVKTVQDAGTKEAEKISSILPVPTAEDAGKVPVVSPDGSGYKLGEAGVQIDDKSVSAETTWSSRNILQKLCQPFESSGSIVTCNPVEGSQLNTVVQIEPVQEGTGDPSPDNVRPIQGFNTVNVVNFTGKNLIDFKLATPYGDGTIEILENGVKWSGIYYFAIPVSFPLKKGKAITASWISNVGAGQKWRVRYTDGSYSILTDNGKSLQLDDIKTVSELMIYKNADWEDHGENMVYENIQLEYGAQSTSYEPYSKKNNIVTISIGQIVYGGTLDVGSGTLTVTKKHFTLTGAEPFALRQTIGAINRFWYTGVGINGDQSKVRLICNYYPSFLSQATATGNVGVYQTGSATNGVLNINLLAAEVPNLEAFNNLMKSRYDAGIPVEVVADIGVPFTIQLTPQEILALSGVNTVYADAGDVTVSGHSDPTTIIKNLTDRIAALEQNAIGG